MIILRQKEYARKDYKGLDYFSKKDLKKDRNRIAGNLNSTVKYIKKSFKSKKYKPDSLRTLFTDPEKVRFVNEVSGNEEARDRYIREAREAASKLAESARKNAIKDTKFRKSYREDMEREPWDLFGISIK